MLVLKLQKPGDAIVVRHRETGQYFRLIYVERHCTQFKLGIEANDEWHIVRQELLERDKQREREKK